MQKKTVKPPRINSRQKGAAGERELANWLKDRGLDARRGQQFSGGKDSPDVVTAAPELAPYHIECKRVEAGNPYVWMDQAIRDGVGKVPIVFHRKNKKEWLVILRAEDFVNDLVMKGILDA